MVKIKRVTHIHFSPKERVVKYLIEHKSPQSIRETSCAIVMDYKNTHTLISGLHPTLIHKEKIGNINIIQLKASANHQIYAVEEKRAKEFLQSNKELALLQEDTISINYPFMIVLVFGSRVKKTNTAKSDIDLCIIADAKEKVKELTNKLQLLPLPLEIHEFTSTEFTTMLKTTENNIGKEIIRHNIILYGIENYYRLIEPWMKKE